LSVVLTQSGSRVPLSNPATPTRIGSGWNPTIAPSSAAPCRWHMTSSTSSSPSFIVRLEQQRFVLSVHRTDGVGNGPEVRGTEVIAACGSPKSYPSTKSTGCRCVHTLLSGMNIAHVPPLAGSALALLLFPEKAPPRELGTAAAVERPQAQTSASEAHSV
jgi:hypothetical protein